MMTKLGIQAIIFGKRNQDDFPGVLRDIKAAGYDGIEFGMRQATPEEVKGLLSDADLLCCGYHAGYQNFLDLEDIKKQAEHLTAVGGHYLMCSGNEGWKEADRDAYLRSCETYTKAATLLKEHGVTFCYHNHNWEFFPLKDGGNGMDVILGNTDPALVKLCVDIYWVACGGGDAASFIRANAERAVYFHYKDGTFDAAAQQPLTFTELGRGQVDLKAATVAVRERSPEWAVTEQDRTDGDPAESAAISAAYARKELGF
jgi:sugar phosphate isomerase/epimerase